MPISLPPYGAYLVVFKDQPPAFHYGQVMASGAHPPRLQYVESGLVFLEEGNFELTQNGSSTNIESQPEIKSIEGPLANNFSGKPGGTRFGRISKAHFLDGSGGGRDPLFFRNSHLS